MLKKQILNFILVGVINTLFGYSLYALFIYIGFNYSLSLLYATVLGVLFNFKTIGKYVFNSKENKTIIKFILVYISIYLINLTLIKLFKSFDFNNYIAGFCAIIPASVLSFVLNKHYVFKENKNEIN